MNGDNFGQEQENRGIRATGGKIALAAVSVAILGTGAGLALTWGGSPSTGAAPRARPAIPAAATSVARAVPAARTEPSIPMTTELATLRESAIRYASPGLVSGGSVPALWYGRKSVLPVVATRPGWVEVRLAQRPNKSTAWVPATDVRLSSTPYRIVVNVTTMHLALYKYGRLVFTAAAGVGTTDDPTPTGHFFVAFDEPAPQPNPGYGSFIMVTSAHSPHISDWEHSGDAIIGIHGPLGDDSEIGTTGARVSHGCVRLHDQALERLSGVPAGTPLDVVS